MATAKDARAFVAFFCLTVALGLCVVVGVGLAVDPTTRIFGREKVVTSIVRELTAGRFVAIDHEIDDRFLQKAMVDELTAAPGVVITGSSRSRNIGQGMFPAASVRNSSVNSGALEDHIAIYGLYEHRGMLPKVAVINVDPWLFNGTYQPGLWRSIGSYYDYMLDHLSGGNAKLVERPDAGPTFDEMKQLLSMTHFEASWKMMKRSRQLGYFIRTLPESADDFMIRPDGSFRWDRYYERQTVPQSNERVSKEGLADAFVQLKNFGEMSRERVALFEKLVHGLERRGVKVILLMLPYHPTVYPDFARTGIDRRLSEVSAYVRSLQGPGIEVAGSYDPAAVPCGVQDFVDGHHPLESCSGRILATLRPWLTAQIAAAH